MNFTSGWRRMTPRFSARGALGLLLLLQAMVTQAQQQEPAVEGGETAARGPETAGVRLSLQFFEFLGEFTTEDGEWVDPAVLMESDIVVSAGTATGHDAQERDGQGQIEATADNCLEPRCKP